MSTSSVSGSYTYDLANNLNAGGNGWQYNANAQLTSAPASGGLSGASGLTYDASGNLKTLNGNTLTYDAWGRLSSITGPNGSISYTYDGAGRMLTRTSGGITTYFLYEGDTLLAELDSQGYLLTGYVWGANGLVSQHTANLVILEGSGLEEGLEEGEEQSLGWPGLPVWDSLYYLFDGLGNTRGLTDANGSVVGRSSFSGWGGNLQILGVVTPFARGGQFGGRTESVGSGGSGALVLSGHVAPRVYVPGTGQYGTPAGVGFSGGHPYANPGADGVNEEELSDRDITHGGPHNRHLQQTLNQFGQYGEMALETFAGLNPACSAAMAFSGYNAAGKRIGGGERLLNAMGMIPGGGLFGDADDVGKAVNAAGKAVRASKRERLARTVENELTQLADDAHDLLDDFDFDNLTTAIGRYEDGSLGIASSEDRVPPVQRQWAKEKGIHVYNGIGHAEETLINGAGFFSGKCLELEPNRLICLDCEEKYIKPNNIKTTTPFSGKPSRNRRRRR